MENLEEQPIYTIHEGLRAEAKHGDTHLVIFPDSHGPGPISGYNVYFLQRSESEKPDFGNVLNSCVISGSPGDIEEIADLFARRLVMGIDPQKMFVDIEQASIVVMKQIAEAMKAS